MVSVDQLLRKYKALIQCRFKLMSVTLTQTYQHNSVTLIHSCLNAGQPSATLAQHSTSNVDASLFGGLMYNYDTCTCCFQICAAIMMWLVVLSCAITYSAAQGYGSDLYDQVAPGDYLITITIP